MIDIFSVKECKFPKGFLWGSSTAGHQIEGDNVNSQWWKYEHDQVEKGVKDFELSGKACNSYNLWQKDNEILSTLKHQVFRMSIEWARIEPNEGEFKIEEIDHYVKIFEDLKKRGIKISLTMIHETVPQWFYALGGFSKMDNLKYFERFFEYAVPKIAQYVDFWNVLNEFNMGIKEEVYEKKFNCVRYHARGYRIIKKYSDKPVSSAHAFIQYYAKRQNDKFDFALQNYYDTLCNEYWFHAIRTGELIVPFHDAIYDKEIKDSCDFWAINFYIRKILDMRKASSIGDNYSWTKLELLKNKQFYIGEINPECAVQNLLRLQDKPVLITENGLSCDDDRFRIIWIAEYLTAIKEAMDMGVNVIGYLYWSLLDNYEWGSFRPTFGLTSVDKVTFERTIKQSAYFYRDVIENNGVNSELIKKYLTDMPTINK